MAAALAALGAEPPKPMLRRQSSVIASVDWSSAVGGGGGGDDDEQPSLEEDVEAELTRLKALGSEEKKKWQPKVNEKVHTELGHKGATVVTLSEAEWKDVEANMVVGKKKGKAKPPSHE